MSTLADYLRAELAAKDAAIAELRARAEKAEAEIERLHHALAVQNAWANDYREQRDTLRDGIQALADTEHWRPASWWRSSLRALLSPTPEDKL